MRAHRGIVRRRNRRAVTAVLACAAVLSCMAVMGAAGVGSAAAEEGPTNSYRLSVVATSAETLVQSKSLPVIGISGSLQIAAFGASAGLSSVGDSAAEAGVPFSPFASSLPGTFGGLVGAGAPKIPTLPGFVSSSYPDRPTASSSQHGFGIKATSAPTMSEGVAGLGATSPGTRRQTAFAHAKTVANDDGSVSATGATGVDLLNFGDLFDIGNVSTAASIDISQAGNVAYKGNSQLGNITLRNLPTGVDAKGLGVLGAGVPIPIRENLEPLNDLLKPLGVTIRLLDADFLYADGSTSSGDSPDPAKALRSVVTAGLAVAVAQDVPTQGIITVTEILGRTIVTATNRPDAALGSGTGPLASSSGTSDLSSGASGVAAAPSSAGGDSGAAIAGLPSLSNSGQDGGAGDGTQLVPTVGLSPGAGAAQGQAELVAVRAAQTSNAGEGPYLLLVLAGLIAVLSSLLIRVTAVRLTFFKP